MINETKPTPETSPTLVPIPVAAKAVGIEYRQLLAAVKEGLIPHFRIRRSRMLVSVSQILEIMRNNGEKK